jgi:hypothetical protein
MDWMSGWSWRTARWIAASLVAPVKSHGLEGNAVGDATTSESMQPPAWVERQGRVGASRFRAAATTPRLDSSTSLWVRPVIAARATVNTALRVVRTML